MVIQFDILTGEQYQDYRHNHFPVPRGRPGHKHHKGNKPVDKNTDEEKYKVNPIPSFKEINGFFGYVAVPYQHKFSKGKIPPNDAGHENIACKVVQMAFVQYFKVSGAVQPDDNDRNDC